MTPVYIFKQSIKQIGQLSTLRKGCWWQGRVVTQRSCHFAYICLSLSSFSVVKSPSHSQSPWEISSHIIFFEEWDSWLTAYLQITLSRIDLVPSSCPENVAFRRCKDSSVSAPKFSLSFCTFWKQCVCARDNYKERSLGNCEEITKGCLDVDDFHSLRLWQDWPKHSGAITLLGVKLTVHHIL